MKNKTLIKFNLWQMILIYIIAIGLGFYTNLIIGIVISVFSIFSCIYIYLATNKIKQNNEKIS